MADGLCVTGTMTGQWHPQDWCHLTGESEEGGVKAVSACFSDLLLRQRLDTPEQADDRYTGQHAKELCVPALGVRGSHLGGKGRFPGD